MEEAGCGGMHYFLIDGWKLKIGGLGSRLYWAKSEILVSKT
jgi:hypothetical protein